MNAPPYPLNPAVGQRYGQWVWNGVQWTCAPANGVQVLSTVFTSSGPYMPSPGLVSVEVECIGGGGAGGPAQLTYSGTAWKLGASGGGGGAGAYSRKTLPASLVMGGVAITIGAGGAPGGSNSALAGGNGAATSFGALCVAPGGQGGGANNISGNDTAFTQNGQYGQGGQGGGFAGGGIGDWIVDGSSGTLGPFDAQAATVVFEITIPIGRGAAGAYGAAPWGGLGLAGQTGGAAGTVAQANTGAGGGAGWCAVAPGGGPQNSFFGGAGGSGVCIVTEYCWSFANEDDCLNPPVNVNARIAVTHVPWQGPGPCPPGWGGHEALEFEDS